MEFAITEYKHYDLMEITGRIDSYTAPKVEQALQALITDEHYNIVIDMKDVTYLSSSGILVFVNIQRRFQRQNRGRLVFSGTNELVYTSFELAGFHRLFDFFNDVVSAVGGC
jgi:anti-sigma B factor antagonist